MTGDTPPIAPEPAPDPVFVAPPRRSRALWIIAGLAFALGIVAMYYLLPVIERWRAPAQPAAQTATTTKPTAQPVQQTITAATPITLDGLAAREAALDAPPPPDVPASTVPSPKSHILETHVPSPSLQVPVNETKTGG